MQRTRNAAQYKPAGWLGCPDLKQPVIVLLRKTVIENNIKDLTPNFYDKIAHQ